MVARESRFSLGELSNPPVHISVGTTLPEKNTIGQRTSPSLALKRSLVLGKRRTLGLPVRPTRLFMNARAFGLLDTVQIGSVW